MYNFPPISAAISALYSIVDGLATTLGSAALAIVAITMLIRLLLLPLGWLQVRAEVARSRLSPEVQDLQRRHKRNPERLRRELAELYSRERTSPLAGCLPSIAQAPFFMVLYGMFGTATIGGNPNTLLTDPLGGVPLGTHLIGASTGPALAVFAALLILLAVVAWLSSRRLPANQSRDRGKNAAPSHAAEVPTITGPGRMLRYAPFATVAVAAFVPLAAGLYLLTTSAWTLSERAVLRRFVS